MTIQQVLVVDDEPDLCELLSMTLKRMDLDCFTAGTLTEAIDFIQSNDVDLVLTDMRLPDGDGLELVKLIQRIKPSIPIAVITAYGHVDEAVRSLKAGAFDYVSKPLDLQGLKALVNTAISMSSSPPELIEDVLLGESEPMIILRQHINKLSRSQAPIFIQGESGVGKELVAKLIHRQGPRSNKPFIAVNCGAIPSELMESEFFGHRKGSFTGAIADKSGLFVAANGGTLFLDEIAELPLAMQVKLLRAIQEKAIKPIGDTTEITVDVRILSASHEHLQDLVASGLFRQDLYYRINVIQLDVVPLRERLSDVPLLAKAILKQLIQSQNLADIQMTPSFFEALSNYSFPGNVRELENILERALALREGHVLEMADIQRPITASPEPIPLTMSALHNTVESQEKQLILETLEKTKWNRTAAAKLLGLTFRMLRYRLKKLGIDS